ncbi:hypothetical protein PN36_03420 [Candidatus Thiomargarita nelsonii]|uniref:Thymidylate synthase n=1 Tax=Candidatus Thiomargarita nelsonii TaxID=1003181 RepID=A0A0A6PLL1_9GAMM|nr:hypothetical protein PN36_03420 [Candidatus Thiomargarita nelsonii]
MIELTTKIVQTPEILAASVDDETMAMDLESNNYYGMGRVGSHIWELLEQPLTIVELCSTLQKKFEVDSETCQRDVLPFVQQLVDEKLVRIVKA